MVVNPEYGERLGDPAGLEPLYRGIGDFFKQKCAGYRCYIFTGNMDMSRRTGLRTKSRKIFYNSRIECRLLEFEMYEGSRRKGKLQTGVL